MDVKKERPLQSTTKTAAAVPFLPVLPPAYIKEVAAAVVKAFYADTLATAREELQARRRVASLQGHKPVDFVSLAFHRTPTSNTPNPNPPTPRSPTTSNLTPTTATTGNPTLNNPNTSIPRTSTPNSPKPNTPTPRSPNTSNNNEDEDDLLEETL